MSYVKRFFCILVGLVPMAYAFGPAIYFGGFAYVPKEVNVWPLVMWILPLGVYLLGLGILGRANAFLAFLGLAHSVLFGLYFAFGIGGIILALFQGTYNATLLSVSLSIANVLFAYGCIPWFRVSRRSFKEDMRRRKIRKDRLEELYTQE